MGADEKYTKWVQDINERQITLDMLIAELDLIEISREPFTPAEKAQLRERITNKSGLIKAETMNGRIIPAHFYRGDLDELRYSNLDWWRDEVKKYFKQLDDDNGISSNNSDSTCVFD